LLIVTPTPLSTKRLAKVLSLADFEPLARKRLPGPLYAYVSGACEDNASLRANLHSFDDYAFRSRVLVDVSQRSTQISLFGTTYNAPIGLAPMGICALTSYRGDLVLARAAQVAGVPFIMSGSSLIRLEELAQAAPDAWFQAYLPGKLEQIDALVERVKQARFHTLVLTADVAVSANRENNLRAGFSSPLRPSARLAWEGATHPRWLLGVLARTLWSHGMPHFENNYATRGVPVISPHVVRDFSDRSHLTWEHVAHIRQRWAGRIVLKGVLHAKDAALAQQYGIDGLIVSNHGGRQLDGAVAPLRVLEDVVAAFRHGPVMLDGGVTRGSQVLKAMALGAACVFVGRPFNYAATVAGQTGVSHAIGLLAQEVSRNMGLLGITKLDQLDPSYLIRH
jgi:L-lactate dehydrogenase (cytochrome)